MGVQIPSKKKIITLMKIFSFGLGSEIGSDRLLVLSQRFGRGFDATLHHGLGLKLLILGD